MIKLRKNLWAGVIAAVMGVGLWLLIPLQIRSKVVTNTAAVGPDFFPRLVAVLLVVLGIIQVIRTIVKKDYELLTIDWGEEKRVLSFFILFLAYILLVPIVTYLPATLVFGCGCLALMKDKDRRHYVVVLVLTACVFCLFRFVLHVPLP